MTCLAASDAPGSYFAMAELMLRSLMMKSGLYHQPAGRDKGGQGPKVMQIHMLATRHTTC
jgi:hypothetical protein